MRLLQWEGERVSEFVTRLIDLAWEGRDISCDTQAIYNVRHQYHAITGRYPEEES